MAPASVVHAGDPAAGGAAALALAAEWTAADGAGADTARPAVLATAGAAGEDVILAGQVAVGAQADGAGAIVTYVAGWQFQGPGQGVEDRAGFRGGVAVLYLDPPPHLGLGNNGGVQEG